MDLFSCRNCTKNPGQGLNFGPGHGFCLQFDSVVRDPGRTTCKYLHRKDLPHFHVDEATREHAAEFSELPGMLDFVEMTPVPRIIYSEKHDWEGRTFDPILNALAQYHRMLMRLGTTTISNRSAASKGDAPMSRAAGRKPGLPPLA